MLSGVPPRNHGKIPARLFEDLIEYDPTAKDRNVLCDPPPYVHWSSDAAKPSTRHRHEFNLRPSRCSMPKSGQPETSKPWTVSALCEFCRLYVELTVDSSHPSLFESSPCPDSENPTHFFQYLPSRSRPVAGENLATERWEDVRVFTCASERCPTTVTVTTRPPIIHTRFLKLLTDNDILKRRAMAINTQKEATPYTVFKTLYSYCRHAKDRDQRTIPRRNERFQSQLSDDCREIMERAHFREMDDCWAPLPLADLDVEDGPKIRDLEDMIEETMYWMDRYRPAGQELCRVGLERADRDIKRILFGTHEPSYIISNGPIDLTKPPHTYYAILGVVSEVNDQILTWAFNRQRELNPDWLPFYFDCFTLLATGRKSETLQIEVATLQSQGVFTTADVNEALKALGINPAENDEDLMVGVFRSRLQDSPRQESSLRRSLEIIGLYRQSEKLIAASKARMSLNGAYAWFGQGAGPATEDALILSAYQAKILDSPSDEATGKECLRIVAENRSSPLLLSFLETNGAIYEVPPDINTAYATLGVEDRTISDELLITTFKVGVSDAPSRLSDFRAALRVIGSDRKSNKINEFLQTGDTEVETMGSLTMPVGLENIGNTCYLNSLLQYYFTIKPLRDMVLEYEKYQEGEVNDALVKRVGGRKVTAREIEGAKKFLAELRLLFQDMMTSRSSAVTPKRELAYLVLVSSKDDADKQETPKIVVEKVEDKMEIDEVPPTQQDDDAASEGTLVNETPDGIAPEDVSMVDPALREVGKENLPPTEEAAAELSEATAEEITMTVDDDKTTVVGDSPLTPPPDSQPEPDNQPPPIPERPRRDTIMDVDMFGRQQDVTECIGNVMFQLEAAIKAASVDDNGEQIDLIKDYLYGKTKQTLIFPDSSTRTKDEFFSHLIVDVADGDRDLYAALDANFDVEQVDLEGQHAKRYLSVSQLPPVLQFQVQRVQFSRERNAAYKSNARLKFPETIYMDRYFEDEGNAALLSRREESWKWKEQLKQLLLRKAELVNIQVPAKEDRAPLQESSNVVLSLLGEVIEGWQATGMGSDDDPDFDDQMDYASALASFQKRTLDINNEIAEIDNKIKELETSLNNQFTDLRKYGYHIHSVFIHRGSVSFGHYWIYIYDFQKKIFRKYNDNYVSEVVDTTEVFTHSDTDSSPPTPYFLVFVREDQALDITEAVKRVFPDRT